NPWVKRILSIPCNAEFVISFQHSRWKGWPFVVRIDQETPIGSACRRIRIRCVLVEVSRAPQGVTHISQSLVAQSQVQGESRVDLVVILEIGVGIQSSPLTRAIHGQVYRATGKIGR